MLECSTTLKWMPPPQSPGYLQLPSSVPLKPLSSSSALTLLTLTLLSTGPEGGRRAASASESTPTSSPSPFASMRLNPLMETFDATTWIAFSRPVAFMVAFPPSSVRGLLIRTSSAYVPGQTTTVPPLGAAATAAPICENVAVPQLVPAAVGDPVGETYSVPGGLLPSAVDEAAAATSDTRAAALTATKNCNLALRLLPMPPPLARSTLDPIGAEH